MRGKVVFQGLPRQSLCQTGSAGVNAKGGQKGALGGIALGWPVCGQCLEIDMGGQIGAARMGATFGTGRNMQKPPLRHLGRQPGRQIAHRGQRLQTGRRARAGLDPADRIIGAIDVVISRAWR